MKMLVVGERSWARILKPPQKTPSLSSLKAHVPRRIKNDPSERHIKITSRHRAKMKVKISTFAARPYHVCMESTKLLEAMDGGGV